MDAALERNKWLAGANYSLADIAMSSFWERVDNLGMGELWEPFPHAKKWGAVIMTRPQVTAARAPIEYRLPEPPAMRLDELTGR